MANNPTALDIRIGFQTYPLERYIVTDFTNLVSWPLTSLYIFILYVICANAKLRNNPFFIMAVNLGIADILQMFTIVLHGVVISATGDPWQFPYYLREFYVHVCMTSFFCQLFMMNAIAFNRYVGTCWFQYYKSIFTPKVVYIICVLGWCLGIFMNVFRSVVKAELVYRVYSWTQDFDTSKPLVHVFSTLNSVVVTTGIVCPFVIYLVLIVHFRRINSSLVLIMNNEAEMRRRKQEKVLMLQFAVITLIFTFYESSFHYLFLILHEKVAFILLNFLTILNCSINPICYLCFGSELKKYISFKPKTVVTQVGPLTTATVPKTN